MSNYKIKESGREVEVPEVVLKEQTNTTDYDNIILYHTKITNNGQKVYIDKINKKIEKQFCLDKISELDEQIKRLQTERDFWQNILDINFEFSTWISKHLQY